MCRARRPAAGLTRVKFEVGWVVDGPAKGRGAYCCPAPACLEGVTKKGRLARALKRNFSDAELATLAEALGSGPE
ncbi:MAG: YlxR family protein [Armatimonadetes bacterium]|nr:YlxR family protein [Armatimonadota bacterium]